MRLSLYDKFLKEEYEIPSDKNEVFIGRSTEKGMLENKLNIFQSVASMMVSRQHCVIHQGNGKQPYLEDSNSRFGTYVNGKQIKYDMRANLSDGDKLELGKDENSGKGYELLVKINN